MEIFIKIIIIISTIILFVSSIVIIKDYKSYEECKENVEELAQKVVIEKEESKEEINWEELLNINSDIIGWIKIDDININYPILKDDDSLKYMKQGFDKSHNENGSIFTINNNPFEDTETIIYGHNMKTGLMFSNLAKYMDKSFFEQHQKFDIYTKTKKYKAAVFSCYSIDIEKEENNIKNLDEESKIEYYKNVSKYKMQDIGEIKKIVKLSTCSYTGKHTVPTNMRYFIVAKLEEI